MVSDQSRSKPQFRWRRMTAPECVIHNCTNTPTDGPLCELDADALPAVEWLEAEAERRIERGDVLR